MDDAGTSDGLSPEFTELIRALFGDRAEEILAAMRAADFDPRALVESGGLPDDPAARHFIVDKIRRAMATPTDGQAVNWDVAHDLARQAASAGGDPVPTSAQARRVQDALGVGELWLEDATDFPASGGAALTLSSAEWVETTWEAWQRMVTPVATSVADVLAGAIHRRAMEAGPDVSAGLQGMMRTVGGAVFAMQIGQAIGALSREVMGVTDIGLPLTNPRTTALVPAAIERFADGLDIPDEEVRLFIAVREAASARLFTHVRWLGPHLVGAVEAYARGIEIDVERIEEALSGLDPSDSEAMRAALAGGVFTPHHTPAQTTALERLETTLALVEGWVDEVAGQATAGRLPNAVGLAEMIRRRRASGGPAERAFATLVGLELRPRRAREAAALWRAVSEAEGPAGREALWSHPDVLPSAEELGEPARFIEGRAAKAVADAEVDAAIAQLLDTDE